MERPKNLKVGDKFVVQDNHLQFGVECKIGDVITLDLDDKTSTPRFRFPNGKSYYYQFVGLNPYLELSYTTRFGGRIDDNTVIVHIGKSTGTAHYNPDDAKHGLPFRPEVGVVLAYVRAAGMNAEDVQKLSDALLHAEPDLCQIVAQKIKESGKTTALDLKRPFKVGDKVTSIPEKWLYGGVAEISDINGSYASLKIIKQSNKAGCSPVGTIDKGWRIDWLVHDDTPADSSSKPAFVPHLEAGWNGRLYGNIGEDVGFADLLGNHLKIGDTVTLYNGTENTRECGIFNDGTEKCPFVMGLAGRAFKDGRSGDWQIVKCRSYDDVSNGEAVNGVKYIKEASEK